jgi:DNA-binding transcriptional ArsR family regulator
MPRLRGSPRRHIRRGLVERSPLQRRAAATSSSSASRRSSQNARSRIIHEVASRKGLASTRELVVAADPLALDEENGTPYAKTGICMIENMGLVPDVYDALADPVRRKILDLVRVRERSVSEIVEACQLPQPGISKQLRYLHEAGLVTSRPEGPKRIYRLRPEPLADVDAWLSRYRKSWNRRLDDLEKALDEEERSTRRRSP